MRKVRDVTGWDVFLWLLPGILCVIADILLLTFDFVYCMKVNDWIDPDAWYSFIGHLGIKIWLVLPTIGLMYLATRFAIRRLIFNNKVPEVEEHF